MIETDQKLPMETCKMLEQAQSGEMNANSARSLKYGQNRLVSAMRNLLRVSTG